MSEDDPISIGEVAAASGLRPSALRFYEEEGLISPAGRRGGRRQYAPDVLPRLGLIALCQEAGFTIPEIRELLDGTGTPDRWQRLAIAKLAELDQRLDRLRSMRERLAAALACGCADVARCELVAEAARRRRETDPVRGLEGPGAGGSPPLRRGGDMA